MVSLTQTIIFKKSQGIDKSDDLKRERQCSFIIINNFLQSKMYLTGESNFRIVLNKNIQQIP